MPSEIILIALLVTACFRNSSEDGFATHICENDQQVIDALQRLPQKSVPILVITDNNPMETTRTTKDFIEGNYEALVIVNNTNRQCHVTDDVLNNYSDIRARVYPSLFMVNKGILLSRNKLTVFNNSNLQKIRNSALKSDRIQNIQDTSLPLFQKIINRRDWEANDAALTLRPHQERTYSRLLSENPVRNSPNYPGPDPVNSTTRKRRLDNSLGSGQQGYQTNAQMIRPVVNPRILGANQPERPVAIYPVEQNPLGSMVNQESGQHYLGGSHLTPSQFQNMKHLVQKDPKKKPKFGEGSSRSGQSRSPPN